MSKKPSAVKNVRMLELDPDISQEELQIFLQEADEQLQLLDEDIVKLEKGEDDSALLQEIFRAAHTLKGSSAMLGHTRMAELTHGMEAVLDRVRKKTLVITASVVDALLSSLDTLKILKDEIDTREISQVDIASVISELENVQQETYSPQSNMTIANDCPQTGISLDEESKRNIQAAITGGKKAYKVDVAMAQQGMDWAAIRYFQVLNDLSCHGEIITSNPSQTDIEAQKVGNDMALIYTTDQGEEAIKNQLSQIEDIERIDVTSYAQEKTNDISQETPDTGVLNEKETVLQIQNTLPETQPATEAGTTDSGSQTKGHSPESKTSQTVRIDVQRLDDLMNLVGELAISHPRIHQISRILEAQHKDSEMIKSLGETSTSATKIVNELQEKMMKIRMLPIGIVFNSFPRMVRDLARNVNKNVNFIVEGQETEIDRTVIEHVRDPVVHLLRNAVDHGIETAEARSTAGKPNQATVHLAAYHEEGHIIITTEDDGGGIDTARVKESAIRKGIITEEASTKMARDEILDLIFSPGMSTAKKTTEVSGRGVGLDVVRKNIEILNGVVLVDTTLGQGTKFTLKMPLTLATFQGLLVTSANTIYAIPMISVTETLKLSELSTRTVEDGEIIRIRDTIMPLIRLRKVFHLDGENVEGENYVVVIRGSARSVGLAVDAVMEPQEVIVKSMGKFMGDIKGLAGASILGDGQISLILDVSSLIRASLGR